MKRRVLTLKASRVPGRAVLQSLRADEVIG